MMDLRNVGCSQEMMAAIIIQRSVDLPRIDGARRGRSSQRKAGKER